MAKKGPEEFRRAILSGEIKLPANNNQESMSVGSNPKGADAFREAIKTGQIDVNSMIGSTKHLMEKQDPLNPTGFEDEYSPEVKEYEQPIWQDFLAGVYNGLIVEGGKGLANLIPTVAQAAGSDLEIFESWKSNVTDWFKEQEVVLSDKAYQPIEGFSDITTEHVSSGLGQGIGFILGILGGGGAISSVGKGASTLSKVSSATKLMDATQKAAYLAKNADMINKAQKGAKISARIGSFISGTTLMYPAIEEEAKKAGLNSIDASRFALGVSGLVSMTEGAALEWVGKIATKPLSSSLTKKAISETLKNAKTKNPVQLQKLFLENFSKKLGSNIDKIVKSSAVEFGQEFGQTYIEEGAKQLWDVVMPEKKGKFGADVSTYKQFVEATYSGIMGAIIGGGLAGKHIALKKITGQVDSDEDNNLLNQSLFGYINTSIQNGKTKNIENLDLEIQKQVDNGSLTKDEAIVARENIAALTEFATDYNTTHVKDNTALYQLFQLDSAKKSMDKFSESLVASENANEAVKKVIEEKKSKIELVKNRIQENFNQIFNNGKPETKNKEKFDEKLVKYNSVLKDISDNNIDEETINKKLDSIFNPSLSKEKSKVKEAKKSEPKYGKTYSPEEGIKLTDKVLKDKAGFTNMFNEAVELEGDERQAKIKEIEDTYGINKDAANWLSENIEFEPSAETEVQENIEETTPEEVSEIEKELTEEEKIDLLNKESKDIDNSYNNKEIDDVEKGLLKRIIKARKSGNQVLESSLMNKFYDYQDQKEKKKQKEREDKDFDKQTLEEKIKRIDDSLDKDIKELSKLEQKERTRKGLSEKEAKRKQELEYGIEALEKLKEEELIKDAEKKSKQKSKEKLTESKKEKYNVTNISENEVTVNGIDYDIDVDEKGNIIGLIPKNKPEQTIKNEKLLIAVEVERNKKSFNDIYESENLDEVFEETVKENTDLLILNGALDKNFNETVEIGLGKLYDGKELNENEKIAVDLWLKDAMNNVDDLYLRNPNSEIFENGVSNLELIKNLLYEQYERIEQSKESVSPELSTEEKITRSEEGVTNKKVEQPESTKEQQPTEVIKEEVKEKGENLKQEEPLVKKTDKNLNKENEVEEIKETSYSELTDDEIQSELETNENLTPEQREQLIAEQSKRAAKKQDVENQITQSFLTGGGLDSILDGLEQRSPYNIANEKLLVRNNPELYQKIKEHFAKIFPHIPVHEVDNLGEKYGAKILARVVERGIEIDPNEAIQTSLIHEYTHIFLEILGDNHPLVQLGYQAIEGSQFDKDAQVLYPDKSRKEQLNEALTEALATNALEKLQTKLEGSNLDKFLAFAKRFWKRIKRYFTGAKLDNVNDILSDALVFNNKPYKVDLGSLIGINKNQLSKSVDKKFIKTLDLVQRTFNTLKFNAIEKGVEFKQRDEAFVSKNIMGALSKLYLAEKSGNKEIETKLFDGIEIEGVKDLKDLPINEALEVINNFDEQLKIKDKKLYDNVQKLTKELFRVNLNVSSITEEDLNEEENQDQTDSGKTDNDAIKASKKINNSVQAILSSLLDYSGKRINPDVVFSYVTHVAENTFGVEGLYEKLEKDASAGDIIANRILSVSKGLSKEQKAGFDQVISSLISEQSEALNLNYELDEDGKPTKFSFRNPIVNKDNDLGDTRRNFEKAKNNSDFRDYFNTVNPRIFIDKNTEELDDLGHYLGQLFGVDIDANTILKMIENTKPSKTEKGLSTKEQTFYNRIFGKYASVRTYLNGKQDFGNKVVEWNNVDGFIKEWFTQLSEQSLLQRNYLNGRGNAESSIKLGHWASDLISMLKNDNVTGRMTAMLQSPIYKNNSVLKYFKDKRINWAKLDSVKNLVKDEVVDYSMINANDYQILQAAKYFSNTGDGFYKQSIGVISNRDGMLLFEVPKYSLSELRKEYVKQRDYLQDLLNKQMEGLDASQKKKLIKDFNNLYIYKADNSGKVSIPNDEFISKEVNKIADVLKKNGMYDALKIKESTLKEYFLTEALNRTYLSDIFTGPALYHSNPNSGKGAVESFVKRMSGLNSNGNNIELKNPVTIVVFDGKKSGVTFSDSFGMYGKNLNKEITDFTGSFSPVGINAKNNIFQTDAVDGRNLYIKSSNVNSTGDNLKGLGDVYGKVEKVLNKIEEYLGENANVMLIDKSAMKGTYKYSEDDVLDLDTLIDAAEKGTIEAIANKFHTVKVSSMKSPFNLNKKLKPLDKQTAIFSTQAMLVQFNNDFSKINKFEQVAVKYLLNKMGGKTPMESKAVQWLLNTDNTIDDMLSGMGNREKSVTTEILLAVREYNKNNPDNKIKSFDNPSLRLIYEQHVASALGKSGIKIDIPGNFLHQLPNLENDLEHDEVAVPWAMFADSIDEANELLRVTRENGSELKVAVVRIPASAEVSMFAGKVKRFLDTDANVVQLSNGFVRTSGSDHDGDKAMVYRQEMDKDGNFKPFSLMSQMFNQFYNNLSSEAFVNRSVNNDLEFDVLKDWVNQEVSEAIEEVNEIKKVNTINDIKTITNHSGGAIGSDTEWDIIGSEFGMINNKHYWTETKTPKGNTEISKQDFEEGRFESAKAAKRNFGYQYSAMKDSRLIRNWSQVKHSESIFAIGSIVKVGEKLFPNQKLDTRTAVNPSVTGGTGYAVGMAINNNKPVYVFNQTKGSYDVGWYKYDKNTNDFIKVETPVLTKNFAGIGTRKINEQGKQAIRDVYKKTTQQKPASEESTQPAVKKGVSETPKKETTYKSGSINDVVDIAQKMGFGGQAVGRFAIASKLMSLLSSYNAEIKPDARFNFKGKEIINFTNENLDDVALLLQAALDIGNDPILTETGFTETTIDIGNAMILSGVKGIDVVNFLKSDAIQELSRDFQSKNSVFNTDKKIDFKSYLRKLTKQGDSEISHEQLISLHGQDVADFLMFNNIANDLSKLISFIQLDKSLPNNAQLTDSILNSIQDFEGLSFDVSGLMNRELYKHRLKVLTAQQSVYENTLLSSNQEVKKIVSSLGKQVNNSFELDKKYQGQIEQYLSQKFLKKKRDNVSDFIYSFPNKMETIYNKVVLNMDTEFKTESGADIQSLYEIGLVSHEGFNAMMENYKDLDTDLVMKELNEYSSMVSLSEKADIFRGNSFFDFLTFREVDGKKIMGIKKEFKATDETLSKFREDFKKIQELDPDLANDIIDYQLYRHGLNNKIGSYIEGLPMDINVQSLLLGSKIINTPSRLDAVKKEIKVNLMAANKDMLMKLPSIEILNKYKGDKKLAVVNDVIYTKVKNKNGIDQWTKSNIGKFEADNNFTAFNTEVVKTISQSEINETKNGCK